MQQLIKHCIQELPFEGCGILAGKGQRITRFYPVPNQDRSTCSFSFEPKAYLKNLKQMDDKGLSLLGILHSHPHSDPYPSTRDILEWHYPDVSNWILSLKRDKPHLSACFIRNGQVFPIHYHVMESFSD
ncbi:Mov34/MPN/PAD-1 family protein [Melghirimyces algeriensis]|uniref:Mov34/MPN/PAD-1 family protein n=1 Tax=Melghirimyces algeriensis TaxID=910412 RepID=UPI003CCC648B